MSAAGADATASFQRAQLKIGSGDALECWFNPQQYSISKHNAWERSGRDGSFSPMQFNGGGNRELRLDLLFDGVNSGKKPPDVRTITDSLFDMMEPDGATKQPPTVTFSWGPVVTFDAVCTSLTVTFTLFLPDGTPIRASAGLSLTQVAADSRTKGTVAASQNPTTRADARLSVHVIQQGDSLAGLAYSAYGDPTRWRDIAQENDIDDPTRLPRGRAVRIPGPGSG
ncbi:MAG TPA: hypothetical protein VGI55_03450 [Solirubrobacteraceae bacterium]|jgi:nucleoid-associated protein YgaU